MTGFKLRMYTSNGFDIVTKQTSNKLQFAFLLFHLVNKKRVT